MADLSFLQSQSGTVDLINLHYEQARQPRHHLGLSQAGHECKRNLWYTHKGEQEKDIEGRVLRLFQLGNVLEDQMIADLRACGMLVYGQQKEVTFTQGGVTLVGHIDGIVNGLVEAPSTPHLFECKSASKKKFDELLKLGSYEKWNPVYGWQVQFYMVGLRLKRAVVFVYCKDDSSLYMERIRVDKEATVERLQSVFEAITSPIEPDRLCKRADFYLAKWCPFHDQCFNGTTTIKKETGWQW
jgi:CRISPR/Cas system-associated exonuclease Cas4 (RecB family)